MVYCQRISLDKLESIWLIAWMRNCKWLHNRSFWRQKMVLGHRRLIKKKMQDKRNIVYTVQDLKPAFNVNISSEKLMLYQLLLLLLRILNS